MPQLPDFQRLIGRLRLRHLALLDSLGRDPNLGRAAKTLHMAQPTASKLLREIEHIFETTLFTRNRRGLAPTPAGQALTRRAGVLLAEMHATHAELLSTRQGAAGRLRIGVYPVAVPEFLPRLYLALQKRWPGLHISITEAIDPPLLQQLSSGDIDCIFGRIVMDMLTPDLRHEALYNEETAIVCGTRHPLLKARPADRAALLQRSTWMLPARQGAIYHMVASWLASHGISEPQVEVETTSVFATIEMLNHSELLSILPKNVAQAYAELGKVALLPEGDLPAHYPIGMIYRKEAMVNPVMKGVLEAARECVE
ncbi:LysR family transcriptional regulator [Pusillimonas noertemannii]|uniref:LysR family transcriptional regulator n=1 Tax=Pusillimonas noertemannii TaxID=305977 RepID=UPI00333E43F3